MTPRVPRRSPRRPPKIDPTPTEPVLLRVPKARYLQISGQGSPGASEFRECLQALYQVGYALRATYRAHGSVGFSLGRLEGLYWGVDLARTSPADSAAWRWRLILRVPPSVRRDALTQAIAIQDEKGGSPRAHRVELADVEEGECVQLLHVGPYAAERDSFARMEAFAHSLGRQLQGPHHEIYLSDPRRVPARRLRTILRMPAPRAPAAGPAPRADVALAIAP